MSLFSNDICHINKTDKAQSFVGFIILQIGDNNLAISSLNLIDNGRFYISQV